jgi:hypothetical protein
MFLMAAPVSWPVQRASCRAWIEGDVATDVLSTEALIEARHHTLIVSETSLATSLARARGLLTARMPYQIRLLAAARGVHTRKSQKVDLETGPIKVAHPGPQN